MDGPRGPGAWKRLARNSEAVVARQCHDAAGPDHGTAARRFSLATREANQTPTLFIGRRHTPRRVAPGAATLRRHISDRGPATIPAAPPPPTASDVRTGAAKSFCEIVLGVFWELDLTDPARREEGRHRHLVAANTMAQRHCGRDRHRNS